MPELVEVAIAAKPPGSEDIVFDTLIVNFTNRTGGDIGEYFDVELDDEHED